MINFNGVPQTSMDLIRLILVNQMSLQPDHVNIYDNKWIVPNYDEMFIVVEYRSGKNIGNNNRFINSPLFQEPIEVQTVNMLEKIVVGVFSRNDEAQLRKEEVLMSIFSSYAQLMQEEYAFKICRAADIEDLSTLEGAAMLKRYDIELSVYAWYSRTIKPGFIKPPFNIMVKANDASTKILQAEVTASSQLPGI